MIRTTSEYTDLVSDFLSKSFLDFMGRYCDIDKISLSESEKCKISEEEIAVISDDFVYQAVGFYGIRSCQEVGGFDFIKRKIVQMVKIARLPQEVQLDLVSELLLYLIGLHSVEMEYVDDSGQILCECDVAFTYDRIDELLGLMLLDPEDDIAEDINGRIRAAFTSFCSLMSINGEEDGYVFWDADFTFLMEDDVVEGIEKLYTVSGDYDREYHLRPWKDIFVNPPVEVIRALDCVEIKAAPFGGRSGLQQASLGAYHNMLEEIVNKKD